MTKLFHRRMMLLVPPAVLLFSCMGKKEQLRLVPVHTAEGWGYRILEQQRPLIYQVYIPAIAGHHPFSSKEDAMRAGRLVMRKLQQGQSPAVSLRELDSLGIRPN